VQHYFDLHGREPIAFRRADARTDPLPLGAAGPRVILLRSGRNGGFAAGCNLGARALGPACDFTWYLNPDTVVTTDTLARLLERALAADRPGMVGATLRYYDQPDLVQVLAGGAIDARSGEARHIGQHCPIAKVPVEAHVIEAELAYIMGACMLVSRSFLEQVGPMREDYFLYYEDADWGVRGAAHFKLGYAPASHVFHKSGTSTSRALPAFSARFYYRNGIRFLSRHFPQHLGRARTLLLCETLRLARRRRWQECVIAASTWWNARRLAAEARR
jgi:GT2 family glycosyltransferase